MRIAEISSLSWSAAESKLESPATLAVSIIEESGAILGAFQRSGDAPTASFTRASGGSALSVSSGAVHVALALLTHDALVSCTRDQILNRYVRPLLRGLTKSGSVAHYFGRDWVSVGHRPVAFVGFAHHAGSGRTSFEAFVAVSAPLWSRGGTAERASHSGKAPASLSELAGKPVDSERVAEAITRAYTEAFGPLPRLESSSPAVPVTSQPSWEATAEEAIGLVCAGADEAGHLRVGGELMVSRDAISRLEIAISAAQSDDEIRRAVDDELAAPGVALFGVKRLESIAEVIARALR